VGKCSFYPLRPLVAVTTNIAFIQFIIPLLYYVTILEMSKPWETLIAYARKSLKRFQGFRKSYI